MTSVIVHVSPLALVFGLRWHPDSRFAVCPGQLPALSDTCDNISYFTLVYDAMIRFYLPWSICYFLWIFCYLGSYIESKQYQTLWDRVLKLGAPGRFLSSLLKKIS